MLHREGCHQAGVGGISIFDEEFRPPEVNRIFDFIDGLFWGA